MQATDFEYRRQKLLHQFIGLAAFLTYLIDRDDVEEGLVRGGGGDGDAHVLELGTGASLFFGAGITLHNIAEFLDAGIFLAEFEKSHALFVARRGEFEALRIVVEDLVVLLNGLFVLMLGVSDFAEIELRV